MNISKRYNCKVISWMAFPSVISILFLYLLCNSLDGGISWRLNTYTANSCAMAMTCVKILLHYVNTIVWTILWSFSEKHRQTPIRRKSNVFQIDTRTFNEIPRAMQLVATAKTRNKCLIEPQFLGEQYMHIVVTSAYS